MFYFSVLMLCLFTQGFHCITYPIKEECLFDCKPTEGPVCAVDKDSIIKVFQDNCQFELENCMQSYLVCLFTQGFHCKKECLFDCTPTEGPVCAVDKDYNIKVFQDNCQFGLENCMHSYLGYEPVECSIPVEDTNNCEFQCAPGGGIVCAEDAQHNIRVFDGSCQYMITECENPHLGLVRADCPDSIVDGPIIHDIV